MAKKLRGGDTRTNFTEDGTFIPVPAKLLVPTTRALKPSGGAKASKAECKPAIARRDSNASSTSVSSSRSKHSGAGDVFAALVEQASAALAVPDVKLDVTTQPVRGPSPSKHLLSETEEVKGEAPACSDASSVDADSGETSPTATSVSYYFNVERLEQYAAFLQGTHARRVAILSK